MQFGAKPLFENISVRFGDGNRYGLIGANGCGKSTFMKILGGDLEPSAGNVSLDPGERLGKLRQDQFAYEDVRVLDVVMMGHTELWDAIAQRDAIYANPEATDDDYMRAAELEGKVAEYDGYSAEARAGELLLGLEIASDLHQGPIAASIESDRYEIRCSASVSQTQSELSRGSSRKRARRWTRRHGWIRRARTSKATSLCSPRGRRASALRSSTPSADRR